MFLKLLILFTLVPLAELYLFMTLGAQIGVPNTIATIILTAILGAALTKSQGRRALLKLNQATAAGRLPAREAFDGLLILIAGAVLITPGFLTDTIGFLLLVPPIRTLAARVLARYFKGKIQILTPQSPSPHPPQPKSKLDDGNVIDV